jgi:hypothetical protein
MFFYIYIYLYINGQPRSIPIFSTSLALRRAQRIEREVSEVEEVWGYKPVQDDCSDVTGGYIPRRGESCLRSRMAASLLYERSEQDLEDRRVLEKLNQLARCGSEAGLSRFVPEVGRSEHVILLFTIAN